MKKLGRKSANVAFRLDNETHRVLADRGEIMGIPANLLARQYTLEALLAPETLQNTHEEIERLKTELAQFRKQFGHAVQVLLVSAGKIKPEQAEAWVQENFKM